MLFKYDAGLEQLKYRSLLAQSDLSLRCAHEEACILGYPKYAQLRFKSDCANTQHHENMPIYKSDPLKSHFYIVKLGPIGVHIIFFLFCSKTLIVGSNESVLTSTNNNLCFEQKYEK